MHMLVVVPINRVSTHSRAEAAAFIAFFKLLLLFVSTHSRAEAAALSTTNKWRSNNGFNTQPRGGGCFILLDVAALLLVSTHSRAEAAA